MAYVLGYFAADGAMIKNNRGAHFIEFHSTDKILITHVRNAFKSSHRIGVRKLNEMNEKWKPAYRIQFGSLKMFADLKARGFSQNKSKIILFPPVPAEYIGDFVRGYFDGDGNVYFKKHWAKDRDKERWVFSSRFISGSNTFLVGLHNALKTHGIKKGFIVKKSNRSGFELILSHRDSLALYRLMYHNVAATDLCLPRKRRIFKRAMQTLYQMRV